MVHIANQGCFLCAVELVRETAVEVVPDFLFLLTVEALISEGEVGD